MTKGKGKFYYFKVSENILEADIKKSELWVYLTHCRSRGIYSEGYSIAGLNAVTKIFGNKVSKNVYDKSIKGLQDKGLIKISDTEIKKGFYKSDEVIEVIDGKRNIQLPIDLLDKQIITNLSVSEVKDIIKLCSLYNPLDSLGGIDYNCLHDMGATARAFNVSGLGRNNFMKLLREQEILQKNNNPYQYYMDRGYFEVIVIPNEFAQTKTVVTPKGLKWLAGKLVEWGYIG